jgi:hypothetical protein
MTHIDISTYSTTCSLLLTTTMYALLYRYFYLETTRCIKLDGDGLILPVVGMLFGFAGGCTSDLPMHSDAREK